MIHLVLFSVLLLKSSRLPKISGTLPINHHTMKGDKFGNWQNLKNQQGVIPKAKQENGSTKDKFPVVLDDGKTIIFIDDKTKAKEVIERYKNRGKL